MLCFTSVAALRPLLPLQVDPRPVTHSFFSDRSQYISPELSREIVNGLRQIGMIDYQVPPGLLLAHTCAFCLHLLTLAPALVQAGWAGSERSRGSVQPGAESWLRARAALSWEAGGPCAGVLCRAVGGR